MVVAVALSAAACSSAGDDGVTATTNQTPTTDAGTDAPESTAPDASTAPATPSSGSQPADTPPAPPVFEPQPIEWTQFNDAVDVGTLAVPVDYADPAGPTFELHLARYNALDQDYDRLQTPHRELYACEPCSQRKEKRRLGLG